MPHDYPLDIMFLIIEEVDAAKDIQGLKAIALVCKDLLKICQQHLFSELAINTATRARDIDIFLDQKPHLQQYVQTLRILDGYGVTQWWLLEDEIQPPLLHLMHSLQPKKFFLFGSHYPLKYAPPREQEKLMKLHNAILVLVGRPNLTDLYLQRLGHIPMVFFSSFGHLRLLSLHDVTFEAGNPDIEVIAKSGNKN